MPNLTLSVPEDLKKQMEEFKEINWSEVARESIRKRAAKLAMLKVLDALIEERPELIELVEKLKASPEDLKLQLALSDKILKKSKLSEEEADKFAVELGRKMKRGRFERLKKAGWV